MYMFLTPGPSIATIPIWSTRKGKATTVSTSRMTRVSTQPPRKPASSPSAFPSNQAKTTEKKPSLQIDPRRVERARENVAPEVVGPEEVVGPGGSSAAA